MPQWSDQFPWYIKQPIDQTAHFVATVAGVWVVALLLFQFVGVPVATFIGGSLTFAVAWIRELDQLAKRENLKLGDMGLDLVFLIGGTMVGAWSFMEVML